VCYFEQVDEIIRTDSTCSIWPLPARADVPDALEPVLDPVLFVAPLPDEPVPVALVAPPSMPLISTCSFTCDDRSDSCPSSMYVSPIALLALELLEPVVPVAPVEPVAEPADASRRM
jgi:hypothetical protein